MKQNVKLFSFGLAMLMLSSCAVFQSKPKAAVLTYEMIGTVMTEFERQAKPLCDSGVIKATDCIALKSNYNRAREMFIHAGNMLAAGIDNKNNLEQFSVAMDEINQILPEIIRIMAEYGIQIPQQPLKGGVH